MVVWGFLGVIFIYLWIGVVLVGILGILIFGFLSFLGVC